MFELVRFGREESPGLSPELGEVLYGTGVPKDLFSGRYVAAEALTGMAVPGRGWCVRFGSTHLTDPLCVDPASGEVIELPGAAGGPLLVNSTLAAFVRTVRAVLERFPYYGRDADDAELDTAAEDLRMMIGSIDPVAMTPDRFWSTFVDDVAMGDFGPVRRGGLRDLE